jgi:hypothetical protein
MVVYIPDEIWTRVIEYNDVYNLSNIQYVQQLGRHTKLMSQLSIIFNNYENLYFHYPSKLREYWKRYIDGVSIYMYTPLSKRVRKFNYIKTYYGNQSFNSFLFTTTMCHY